VDLKAFTHSLEEGGPSVIARLQFSEAPYPFFESVSALFVDLGLAHDFGVLLTHPEYERYTFGPRFWMRGGRPIAPQDRLRTFGIAKSNPLVVEIAVSAIGGILTLIQVAEKVRDWKVNRQKAELELVKLRQENALRHLDMLERRLKYEDAIEQRRNADRIHDTLVQRLEKSELRLEDVDLRKPPRG
jgi:signal transduction histidine kinase